MNPIFSHYIKDEEIKEIAEFYDYIEMQPNSNNKFLIANGTLKSEEDLKDIIVYGKGTSYSFILKSVNGYVVSNKTVTLLILKHLESLNYLKK